MGLFINLCAVVISIMFELKYIQIVIWHMKYIDISPYDLSERNRIFPFFLVTVMHAASTGIQEVDGRGLVVPSQEVYSSAQSAKACFWDQTGDYHYENPSTSALVGGGGVGSTQQPFCTICRKTFSRSWSLQRHFEDVHTDNVRRTYRCEVCHRHYSSRSSLVSHKSQYHAVLRNRNKTFVL